MLAVCLCFVRISSTVEYRYWKSISIIKRYSIDFAPSYTQKYRISLPMSCSFAVLMGDFRSDVSIDRSISWQLRDKAHNKHCCADFFFFFRKMKWLLFSIYMHCHSVSFSYSCTIRLVSTGFHFAGPIMLDTWPYYSCLYCTILE